MANYLALETTDTHARVLLANTDGKGLRVRNAKDVDAPDSAALAMKIKGLVKEWNATGAKTLVAIQRDQCELRRLAVPDVGADEIPDLVRYQALQNFSALGADWPLDFVTLPKTASGTHVLAGAISPDRLKAVELLCEQIECPLEGIVLRPCATAVLVNEVFPPPVGEGLLVLETQAGVDDMFVMIGPKAVLMRSVRLPEVTASDAVEGNSIHAMVIGEARRTIAAATSMQPGLRITRAVICGEGPSQIELSDAIREQCDLHVDCVKDWSGARIHKTLSEDSLQDPTRYLPLIGMVTSELAKVDSVIDFRRPRQRPPAKDNKQMFQVVALLAALLFIAGFFGVRWMLGERDKQLAYLQRQINQQEQPVADADTLIDALYQVENWYVNSPNWLEEFNFLAERLPQAEQVRLREVNCADQAALSPRLVETRDRGRMIVKGYLDSTASLSQMHESIRDEQHRLESGERNQKPDDRDYPWQFGDTIYVSTGPATDAPSGPADESPPVGSATSSESTLNANRTPEVPVDATEPPMTESPGESSPEASPASEPAADTSGSALESDAAREAGEPV